MRCIILKGNIYKVTNTLQQVMKPASLPWKTVAASIDVPIQVVEYLTVSYRQKYIQSWYVMAQCGE